MSPPPIIALIPGAYHQSPCLAPLLTALRSLNRSTRTTTLPSAGNRDATLADDIASIRKDLLLPLVNDGHEVTLVLHSYAGIPGAAPARGLTVPERRAEGGLRGGIVGIICLCAFVVPRGMSPVSWLMVEGEMPRWSVRDSKTGLAHCQSPLETFYHDVEDPSLAKQLVAGVVGHSVVALRDPAPRTVLAEDFMDGRRAYVRTLRDAALPLETQDAMAASLGVKWIEREIDSGHSPFASRPGELAAMLVEIEGRFREVS